MLFRSRLFHLRRLSRRLRIHAHDTESFEQEFPDCVQALTRRDGHGHGRKSDARKLLQHSERLGIRIDVDRLIAMSADMERRLEALTSDIHREAGREFNVDSPKQLREVLFDELGLKPGRKTAKNPDIGS